MFTDLENSQIIRDSKARNYFVSGIHVLKNVNLGVLTLADRMGTRLGIFGPKGLFVTGAGKTLFQLYAARLKGIQEEHGCRLIWYVMTSSGTDSEIRDYFTRNHNFDLHVQFLVQGNSVCKNFNGHPIIDRFENDKPVYASSPNGTGGLYEALDRNGTLQHMIDNDIKYIMVSNIDNMNMKLLDPNMLGIMHKKGLHLLCKSIYLKEKENCGLFCLKNNTPYIIEYFEASDQERELFRFGNLNMFLFDISLLKDFVANRRLLEPHPSKKKIPYCDGNGNRIIPESENGFKYEMLIFDIFHLCDKDKFAIMDVNPNEEYAAIKNKVGDSSPKDAYEKYLNFFDEGYFMA